MWLNACRHQTGLTFYNPNYSLTIHILLCRTEDILNMQKTENKRRATYGESECVLSGLLPAWAQMVAEQDVPTCTFAHMRVHTYTLSQTHTYRLIMDMHGCICKYCPHTCTPTHRCWSAKLSAHSVAQEVNTDRQSGHLRRCCTCFTKIRIFCKWNSFFSPLHKTSRHVVQTDCSSQRHPRPSRIISALEQSILLAWGLNAEGKKAI